MPLDLILFWLVPYLVIGAVLAIASLPMLPMLIMATDDPKTPRWFVTAIWIAFFLVPVLLFVAWPVMLLLIGIGIVWSELRS